MVVLKGELSRVHECWICHHSGRGSGGDGALQQRCQRANFWVGLFAEFAAALGVEVDSSTIFETLFRAALSAAPTAAV